MARAYDVVAIEKKWQRRWADEGTYEVDVDDPRPPWYVLSMYPYPSGPAHMGHVRNYTFGDLLVRHRTMLGKAVLSPFGFDSFGLPAENAAIKAGTHPRIFTEARIAELKESITRLGAVYDWRREIRSHDPEYIRWNQVIFERFFEAGLAYRRNAPVNWCPGCQTVLANEQVLPDGTCERSGDLVVTRDLEQWFFRITAYADELLFGLDDLEWPERVKTMQRNWIGRSEGAEFDLVVEGNEALALRVFTTRPDTSFGMTYAVVAPEHPMLDALTTDEHRASVEDLRRRAAVETDIERTATGEGGAALEKRGAFTGSHVTNPFTGRPVPVYVADYVLMGYGTGAIMAVPAEDERDWDFAQVHGLPIVRTVQPPEGWDEDEGGGRRLHRRRREDQQRLPRRPGHPHRQGQGHRVPRDQRHWRAQGQLPPARLAGVPPTLLGLPDPGRLLPRPRHRARAGGPAAGARPRRRRVPADGRVAAGHQSGLPQHHLPDLRRAGHPRDRHHGHIRRLVVVLPAVHRPVDARRPVQPSGRPALDARRPVHRRHRARHPPPALRPLLHPGPHRCGPGPGHLREPFRRLFTQGMIRMGGTKMSKSKGNLVAPSSYLTTVGADALRLFHLFVGPPGDDMDWSDQTDSVIEGCGRFLDRVWRLATDRADEADVQPGGRARPPRTWPSGGPPTAPSTGSAPSSSGGPTTRPSPTAWSW